MIMYGFYTFSFVLINLAHSIFAQDFDNYGKYCLIN